MSAEINIQLNLEASSGNFRASFRPNSITPDMATLISSDLSQNITTSAFQALGIGVSVSAGGYYWFRNLSTSTSTTFDPSIKIAMGATNGAGTSTPFLNLRPGEFALGRCVTTTMCALSSTATADLQFGILSA